MAWSSAGWVQMQTLRGSRTQLFIAAPAAAAKLAELKTAASQLPVTSGAADPDGSSEAEAHLSKRRQQRPQRRTDAPQEDAVLFIGFHPEELDVVRQRHAELVPLAEHGDAGGPRTLFLDVTYDMLSYTVREVLHIQKLTASAEAGDFSGGSDGGVSAAAVAAGRVVLLLGPTARDLGAQLNDMLAEWGVVPALIAAYQPM